MVDWPAGSGSERGGSPGGNSAGCFGSGSCHCAGSKPTYLQTRKPAASLSSSGRGEPAFLYLAVVEAPYTLRPGLRGIGVLF